MDDVDSSIPTTGSEREVWSGTPSQWQNLWAWVACVLIVPIPWALWPGWRLRRQVTRSR